MEAHLMLQTLDQHATSARYAFCNDLADVLRDIGHYKVKGEYTEDSKSAGTAITRFQAACDEKGVRIRVQPINTLYHVKISIKTPTRWVIFDEFSNPRYRKAPNVYEAGLEKFRRRAKSVLYRPTGAEFLPKPWKFHEARFQTITQQWHSGTTVAYKTEMRYVRVMCVVRIMPDQSLSRDGVMEPGADCWFLLDASGVTGATFNIVSDGEVFYPVTRITNDDWKKAKITRSSGKRTVDVGNMGQADKELMQEAIRMWVDTAL
jgi:hypothetical protein